MTTPRLAVFLRGINLGNRRVTNAELAAAIRAAGFPAVHTYQAAGNLVIDAPNTPDLSTVEAGIAAAVRDGLGFEADAFARSLDALAEFTADPLLVDAEEEGLTPHILFLKSEPDPSVADALQALKGPDDRFPVLDRHVLWLRRGRLSNSPVHPSHLERALGRAPNTMRKVTTLRRMVRKFGAP